MADMAMPNLKRGRSQAYQQFMVVVEALLEDFPARSGFPLAPPPTPLPATAEEDKVEEGTVTDACLPPQQMHDRRRQHELQQEPQLPMAHSPPVPLILLPQHPTAATAAAALGFCIIPQSMTISQ